MTHWAALTLLALVVSAAFAFLMRDKPLDRLIFGIKMFLGLTLFTYITGWVVMWLL